MALIKFIETIESNISTIPINPGQLIFCSDTREIYMDDSYLSRVSLTDIIKVPTEDDRESIFVPLIGKIYLVEETNALYTYNGSDWENITLNIKIGEDSTKDELIPGVLEKKGSKIAPKTLASVVYTDDGNSVSDVLKELVQYIDKINSLAMFKNTTVLSTDSYTIDIGISGYNRETDVLFVYLNSTYLEENDDYVIDDNYRIRKTSGMWYGSQDTQTFNFIVLKSVLKNYTGVIDASSIMDATITENKLCTDLQNKINKYEDMISQLTKKVEQLENSSFIVANI